MIAQMESLFFIRSNFIRCKNKIINRIAICRFESQDMKISRLPMSQFSVIVSMSSHRMMIYVIKILEMFCTIAETM